MNKKIFDTSQAAAKFLTAPPDGSTTTTSKRATIKSTGYKQRAYYISDEQYKKIKYIALEQETDASSIVRAALDEYIKGIQ